MISKTLFGFGLLACAALAANTASAQITLTAGDIALIGWVDNGTPADIYTFVNLADIPAGSKIYFTDNGWDSVGLAFRNTLGITDGDGNENLLMFTAVNLIPAGRIISTTDTSPDFTFTTSGLIFGTGVTTGNYAVNALSQTGDQLYAFQHDTGDNVLNTPTQQHLFVLDDTGVFEPATTSSTGDVPPGLSVAAGTAVTFTQNGSGQNFMGFNTSALSAGSKAQWLAAIADVNNWTFGATGTLPSGTIILNGGVGAGAPFCPGDGTGTACPCANNSSVGANEGCLSSLGLGGKLVATGVGSIGSDTVVLAGSQMPNSSALYFQGTTQASAGAGSLFGDGLRCAAGSVIRLGTKANVAGASQYPAVGDLSVSTKGLVSAPGTRTYQVWYRNAAAFCTASTFNLTNGWEIVWAP
jgi:hypothetical protein